MGNFLSQDESKFLNQVIQIRPLKKYEEVWNIAHFSEISSKTSVLSSPEYLKQKDQMLQVINESNLDSHNMSVFLQKMLAQLRDFKHTTQNVETLILYLFLLRELFKSFWPHRNLPGHYVRDFNYLAEPKEENNPTIDDFKCVFHYKGEAKSVVIKSCDCRAFYANLKDSFEGLRITCQKKVDIALTLYTKEGRMVSFKDIVKVCKSVEDLNEKVFELWVFESEFSPDGVYAEILKLLVQLLIRSKPSQSQAMLKLHVEILKFLITTMSPKLRKIDSKCVYPPTAALLLDAQRFRKLATPLILALLENTITSFQNQGEVTNNELSPVENSQESNWGFFQYFVGSSEAPATSLDDANRTMSLSLLTFLLKLERTLPLEVEFKLPNVYQESLAQIQDGILVEYKSRSFMVFYRDIFHIAGHNIADKTVILLLCVLFKYNEKFLNYVLSLSDPDSIIIPILKVFLPFTFPKNKTNEADKLPRDVQNHFYLILIILLKVTEDDSFIKNINKFPVLAEVDWYGNYKLTNITLGSLLFLGVTNLIRFNLGALRDGYFQVLCTSILANLSKFTTNIHGNAAETLLNLNELVYRKFTVIRKRVNNANPHTTEPGQSDLMKAEMDNYQKLLKFFAGILNNLVKEKNLVNNAALLYMIIRNKEFFDHFYSEEQFNPILSRIADCVNHINLFGEEFDFEMDYDKILSIITMKLKQYYSEVGEIQEIFPVKYRYTEDEDSDRFFMSYIWSVILNEQQSIHQWPADLEI